MKRNRLRELLDADKPTVGTHVITPWPGIVEVIGQTGAFDYIEYVGEYSPFNLELLDNFGRAIELFPEMSSMMKVEEQTKGFIATRAIDAGIQNVLFTDCRSAQEVKECIQVVRPETPEAGGTHGAGMRRNVGYVAYAGSEAWVKAMNDVVIAIMIEKKGAMENLEEILSIKGVDMVQFGPADYSISIGKPGQGGSPEVQKAHRDMIELALKKGVPPRVEVASFEQTKPYIEMGVRHFCIGWDLAVLFRWCHQQAKGMQELLDRG
ncbi:MAG: 2,4-dihydroxyhept-2-ene-1,7-dioic acid aldolase [Deltaproteobacteria bacterium]|nr:2,4-dihydroxyhept-2-ene-1,7-dioic acid aldolase [Deltaproteobacteria bacterium]MBW2051582.1 2,4-dihydroxyhept-2-ene-1,7-dioic acid aldolase [Deltaproteobacteria bacterium]MBW2139873.1 2,4-dihydroxyhept-2-ene-1,7-dioic acid aldolase [Deltaproteobacteria bacterium]MBW2323809.1 2,4-dihydroxyhept-2-ene-1,7-dioic acid aldolase [Deltaproteobacteria bacterium]